MEERQEKLVLVRPPSGEEEVRLVLCRRGETEGGLHGWLGEREVWQESAPLPSFSPHISFIRQALVASLMEPRCWDITVTVSDGVRPLPRLVVALAFPLLQGCGDLHEAEALILPDYSIQALSDILITLLGKEVTHLEEGLEQALLTLNPLPLHAVGIGACDIAKTAPLPLPPIEGEDVEVAYNEPISEQLKGQLERSGCNHTKDQDDGMEPEVENAKDVRDEKPRAHETEMERKIAASSHSGKERRLKCQICRESFPNLYSLVTHEVENHEGTFQCKKPPDMVFEPVRCYKCKEEMTLSSEVAAHGCTQTKYSPTRCLACKKILVNKLQMTNHLCSPPLPSSQLACLSCGLEFASLRRTIIHEVEECSNLTREGHSEFRLKVFTCNICDRHFVIKRKFKLHMERHKKDVESSSEAKDTAAATLSTAVGFPDDIENIDPDMRKTTNFEVIEQIDSKETGGCTAAEDCEEGPPETSVHAKEGDFLKAVKQLQELYEGSCTCHHCGKVLASRKATLEHEVNVHGDVSNADKFFRCEFCPKVFKSKALRSAHMSTHTEERRFQCHLCALRFKTVGNLTAHLASCHDPAETGMMKKFSCKFCSKTFRFPAQIQQHERVHTKEKPFNCQYCGKGFSVKCNLKAHLETHKSVEERSFKCSQCSHTATTLPLLRLHMHSHTGERPYVCELCGESYRRPSNLRRHKKNMCKLRPGAPQDQGDEEMGIDGEEGGVYERIETVVVQDGDEGEIIIETEEYEESEIFVENGLLIETIPMDHHHHSQNILVDTTVEEGIVEEDGIKYETQLVSL